MHRQTTRDGMVAYRILAANTRFCRPDCQLFNLAPGSTMFTLAVVNLAYRTRVNADFLELLLKAMIKGDEKILKAQSLSLCEEVSLRLVDRHLLYKMDTSIEDLLESLDHNTELARVSRAELRRFIISRWNVLHRKRLLEGRRVIN